MFPDARIVHHRAIHAVVGRGKATFILGVPEAANPFKRKSEALPPTPGACSCLVLGARAQQERNVYVKAEYSSTHCLCVCVCRSSFPVGPVSQLCWVSHSVCTVASKFRGGCVCLVALGCWSTSFPRCRSAVSGQHTERFLFLRLWCPVQFLAGSAGHSAAPQEAASPSCRAHPTVPVA